MVHWSAMDCTTIFFAADYTEISAQITFMPRITRIFANLTEGDFVYESGVIDFVIRGI